MYSFDAKKTTQDIIVWINDFFEKNGKGCNAVVGISGGKDSSVVAGLCAAALGKERVIGSIPVCSSPVLIAAYHVLLRLQKPRHPPFALVTFSLNEFL